LDPTEVARLTREISRANAAGLKVIVDLHNGGRYRSGNTELVLGNGITVAQYTDVWTKLANLLNTMPGVYGYDLMNEPNSIYPDPEGTDTRLGAHTWEQFSQAAVDAIRATGSTQMLYVEGVSWASPDVFDQLHPSAWIFDPLNNVRYSAHQYFDINNYVLSGGTVRDLTYTTSNNLFTSGAFAYSPAYSTGQTFPGWALERLRRFTGWLSNNGVRGDIGETSWPAEEMMVAMGVTPATATTEANNWNALAEAWCEAADAADMDVTFFDASGDAQTIYSGAPAHLPDVNIIFSHGTDNDEVRDSYGNLILDSYGNVQPLDITNALSQYSVIQNHLRKP
jgi:endoglucanase